MAATWLADEMMYWMKKTARTAAMAYPTLNRVLLVISKNSGGLVQAGALMRLPELESATPIASPMVDLTYSAKSKQRNGPTWIPWSQVALASRSSPCRRKSRAHQTPFGAPRTRKIRVGFKGWARKTRMRRGLGLMSARDRKS